MAARIRGRWADFAADPAVTFPKTLFCIMVPSLVAGTHTFKRKVRGAGKVAYMSLFTDLNGGTITVDLLKNAASVLDAAISLSDAATLQVEGVGADNSADQNFDTDTAAHRAELVYADGDEWTLTLVVATADALEVCIVVEADELQPLTDVDDA